MAGAASREERIERQEYDDGDPEDTVYFVSKGCATEGWSKGKCYHDEKDCPALQTSDSEPGDGTRKAAQRRWLGPCSRCVIEGTPQADGREGDLSP